MKLQKLTLTNFKGIKHFELIANGENVSVFGTNATGKTTIADGLSWLLFDKDSQDKKQFEIKTLDKNNNPINGLDHEVEGIFLIDDGKEIQLKKVYREIWSKPRGESKKQFTGHTTEYEIDGVPVKKKEFTEKTSQIFNEDQFKLLTNPLYFSEILPWKKRREILLEICGDISDDDVIKSDKKLKGLKEIIKDHSIDDHKKIIASSRKKINESIEKLPIRIDEVVKGMPDISDIEPTIERAEIASIKKQVADKEKQVVRIESGGEVAEKTKKLREIESHLLKLENDFAGDHNSKVQKQRENVHSVQQGHYESSQALEKLDAEISKSVSMDLSLNKRIELLRSDWNIKNGLSHLPPVNPEKCYACGADIDESVRTEISEKAISEFNLRKSESLEKIDKEGKEINRELDDLSVIITKTNDDRHGVANECQIIQANLESERTKLKNLESFDLKPNTKEYVKIEADGITLVKEIELLKSGSYDELSEIKESITILERALVQSEMKLLDVENSKNGKERIEFLEQEEKELAIKLEELDAELFLIESFEKAQAQLIEKKVNGHFELANFKLFKQQINEGIKSYCETTFKGVPYSTGLNNSAKINVGLDIIKTLSKHYGTDAPLFIDNSEAVVETIPIDCQVIKLVVSKKDWELRVV